MRESAGTLSEKWNKPVKVNQDTVAALAALHSEMNFEKREAVFEKLESREYLTTSFKYELFYPIQNVNRIMFQKVQAFNS